MAHNESVQPDFGTGEKRIGIYITGVLSCVLLTLLSFWAVMSSGYSKTNVFLIIYFAAIIQFFVQVICFLRLNLQTEQGKVNVMSLIFVGVILMSIIIGSLWIMTNLNYNMVM